MNLLPAPAAADGSIDHADWLELQALEAADRNSSFQDLVAALRRSGSTDALQRAATSYDRGSEDTQELAEAAFSEISFRSHACGTGYPFEVTDQYIELTNKDDEANSYLFMLLLSRLGVTAGPSTIKGASHFEELCTEAARRYLGGGTSVAESSHFGFPRRLRPANFPDALNDLCMRLGEGGGAANRPNSRDQKDAKLDLVAWSSFPDKRTGKLIAFGQCAAGDNYDAKVTELHPRRFVTLWLRKNIAPLPMIFFFIPRCVDETSWISMTAAEVIAFDRCRISALLSDHAVPAELNSRSRRWNRYVLRKLRSP